MSSAVHDTPSPRWGLHGLAGAAALALLWAFSLPGGPALFLGLFSVLALVGLGVVWLLKLLTAGRRAGGWFLIAPLSAVLVVVSIRAEVPLKVRWAVSQGSFEAARASSHTLASGHTLDPDEIEVPWRLGLYRVRSAHRIPGGGAIFVEANGDTLFNDAGFAYLPDGPSADLATGSMENPEFAHLGDGWYRWTASW